jgi:tRNA wybutosine-synthesizing protein 1
LKTLEILPSLDTRTVARHTLVKGENLGFHEQYAELDRIADPDFIEPKGYVFVGYSRERMTMDNMPSFDDIIDFSSKISDLTGYEISGENPSSRVVLLSSGRIPMEIR